jgi:hypothetical protein
LYLGRSHGTYQLLLNTRAKKTHEEMLTIPGHKMQIKTILRFHLIPVRMVTIKNTKTNIGNDVGKKEPLYTVGGNVS